MKQILLDTNTLSLYFEQDNLVHQEVEEADIIYVSVITLGEIKYGFLKGLQLKDNNRLLNDFLDNPLVKEIDIVEVTAMIYAEIYYKLQKLGLPVPSNDIWIAACAIETDSTIITYDKHFLKIPGVKVWKHLV